MHYIKNNLSNFWPQLLTIVLAAVVAFLPWSKLLHYSLPSRLQDGLTIFTGIIIEALPFVLLGVLVSFFIRRFISEDRMLRLIPARPWLALPFVGFLGIFFPVCECGNVPVARQLVKQGMRPAYAITFLLAAPILNPAVIISTFAAFRFLLPLVFARFVIGFIIALAVGSYFLLAGDKDLLKPTKVEDSQGHDACEIGHHGASGIVDELFEMMTALSFGALLATLSQTLIPREILTSLGHAPIPAILVMMLLALVISLCSNVDAFFALSYASTFSPASLLAFLIFGPMIDFKTISMMSRSWKPQTILTISILVAELVFLSTLGLHHFGLL